MIPVVSTRQMREIEQTAFESHHILESVIIENVGIKTALFLQEEFELEAYGSICLLIGKGNNGADALAMGRQLANAGFSVKAFLLYQKEDCSEELKRQIAIAPHYGVELEQLDSPEMLMAYFTKYGESILTIDGILGTGFRFPLEEQLVAIIDMVNQFSQTVVSMDIASGLDANLGQVEMTAIQADYTLAIETMKYGHLLGMGPEYSGTLTLIDAGFAANLTEEGAEAFFFSPEDGVGALPRRGQHIHKKQLGSILCVGGQQGMTGAINLAAASALKVGAGLVTSACWENAYLEMVSSSMAEVMKTKIESLQDFSSYSAIVAGPGLGQSKEARAFILKLLSEFDGALVLDADALNMIDVQKDKVLFQKRKFPVILTPHLGEFRRLVGQDEEKELIESLKSLAAELNAYIVLKSKGHQIAGPHGHLFFYSMPNEGMATAGAGDVLSGIIVSLLVQYIKEEDFDDIADCYLQSVFMGTIVHSMSGLLAREDLGVEALTAACLLEQFPEVFHYLHTGELKG